MHEVNALSLDPDCFCCRHSTSRDSSIVEHPMLLKFIHDKSRTLGAIFKKRYTDEINSKSLDQEVMERK